MDSKLNWKHRFKIKMDNAKALLFKKRNVIGITWGLSPYLLRWVYTGIVRPTKVYGNIVWAHGAVCISSKNLGFAEVFLISNN